MLAGAAIFPAIARGQQAPPGTVGRVEGLDVSVDGGTAASTGNSQNGPSIFVTNGGVITVHSGQARLTLVAGGQVDICGPTKFTVLNSSDAITLALNFGRLRIQLPVATALRVFTPTIIATPLDISGGNRDITVGLELNDSLCVIAATGALQLEHQFTGEKLVVPQAGEFFLAAGQLFPVAGTPGSCRCIGMQDRPAEPRQQIPEAGLTAPPVIAEPPAPTPEDVAAGKPALAPPPIEFSVPAHANESHPVAPAAEGCGSCRATSGDEPGVQSRDAAARVLRQFSNSAARSQRGHDSAGPHGTSDPRLAIQGTRGRAVCWRREQSRPRLAAGAKPAKKEGRLLGRHQENFRRSQSAGLSWPCGSLIEFLLHFFHSELMFTKADPGQNQRHIDMIWPLWNLFDFTPDGRGEKWYPKLSYDPPIRIG